MAKAKAKKIWVAVVEDNRTKTGINTKLSTNRETFADLMKLPNWMGTVIIHPSGKKFVVKGSVPKELLEFVTG